MTSESIGESNDPRIPSVVMHSGILGMIEAYGGPDECPLSFL